MTNLARRMCDYLIETYGDMTWVNPANFAEALRIVTGLPRHASPAQWEHFVGGLTDLRVGAASSALAGFNYHDGRNSVIETGRGRSRQERNLTIPHEFGEVLRQEMNAELRHRGLSEFDWPDRYWDEMAAELVEPIDVFREEARKSGIDIVELQGRLSFEAVLLHVKKAFDDNAPLFGVYAKNVAKYERGRGFLGDDWQVSASIWTRRWMKTSFASGTERPRLPRAKSPFPDGTLMAEARSKQRALLVRTCDKFPHGEVEATIIIRPRAYGRQPAQVIAVGVERRHEDLLAPQILLADPLERTGTFASVFG